MASLEIDDRGGGDVGFIHGGGVEGLQGGKKKKEIVGKFAMEEEIEKEEDNGKFCAGISILKYPLTNSYRSFEIKVLARNPTLFFPTTTTKPITKPRTHTPHQPSKNIHNHPLHNNHPKAKFKNRKNRERSYKEIDRSSGRISCWGV